MNDEGVIQPEGKKEIKKFEKRVTSHKTKQRKPDEKKWVVVVKTRSGRNSKRPDRLTF